jgi:glycyl-tRNA synthetase beta chain
MPTTSKAILGGSLVLDINKRSDKNALVNTVSFARVLNEGATDEEVTAISALFKRIRNILKQALANGEAFSPQVNKTRLKEPAEQALYEAIVHVEISSQQLYEAENYRQLIQEIAGLSQPLSNFFEHLMVMDSNPMIRETRLSLLQYAEAVVRKFADFSEIVVAG